MATGIRNCNFSCTCNREECERKHYIEDPEDRATVKDIFDDNFDRKIHNETDPDGVRNVPCFFGPLCSKSDCNFKHYCSFDFRMKIMNKEWRKISRTDNKEKVLSEIAGKYSFSDEDLDKLSKLL
jgi:hypothetical protein